MCPHLCACVSFFRLARASQTYLFPIHLTDQLLPSAVFYATAGPLLVYMAVHRLIIVPYTRAQKEESVHLDFTSSFNVTPRQHPLAAVVERLNISLSPSVYAELRESKPSFTSAERNISALC